MEMLLETALEEQTAPSQYLDSTVTKFMDQQADDIAVTKYLGTSSSKFLDAAKVDAAVSQYLNGPAQLALAQEPDDIPLS